MSILTIVVAILLASLRSRVYCDVGNDDVSNYFSSYVPQDYKNPIMEGVSIGEVENSKNEDKDSIVEGIKKEFLPQFSNLSLPQSLKSALLNDYYLSKPYTKGDVSNLYNLDLLGSGFGMDFNTRQKSGIWPSRPNYNWLKRNISWPILRHLQYPRSNSYLNLNTSGFNLCNNHMRNSKMMDKDSVIAQPSKDIQNYVDFKTESSKMVDNGLLESKVILDSDIKDLSGHIESKRDTNNLKPSNNLILDYDSINKLKNLTKNIVQKLPSLSDIYVSQSENDLTKIFNSFNTSSLLNKYENSKKKLL